MRQAAISSIICAAFVSWWACYDSLRLLSLGGLFLYGLKYVVIATFAGAAGLMAGYLAFGRDRRVLSPKFLLTALVCAALLPSLFLFADLRSRLMVVPCVLLAVVGTVGTMKSRAEEGFSYALLASTLLQAGGALLIANRPLWAAPLAAASAATIAARYPFRHRRLRRKRAMILVGTAVVLTSIALLPHLRWVSVPVAEENTAPAARSAAEREPGENTVPDFNNLHQGVIILPRIEKHTRLVVPLPALKRVAGSIRPAESFTIPFFGVYWLFRNPDVRPPRGSLVLRGTPADRTLTSTDRRPLIMQARQNFGDFIDLTCCRSLDIAITNADLMEGSVILELLLRDTTIKGPGMQSAGVLPVTAGGTTLSFEMPAPRRIRRFDEVVLVFHLSSVRAWLAPKIAIERFTFVTH